MATEEATSLIEKESKPARRKRPKSVFYLSLVFIGLGMLSFAEMFFEMSDPTVPVPAMNFLISFIPLGIFLLRGNELARVIAINCAAVVGGFYMLSIIIHFVINRRPDLFYTVIFWSISGGAIVVSLYAIFVLSRRSSLEFFKRPEEDDY